MVDAAASITMDLAAAQLGVQRVVHPAGVPPDVECRKVSVEQLVYRRARAWVALLVDLVEEPGSGCLGDGHCLQPGRDHLDKVVAPTGDGVLAGVDTHSQRTARQLVDRAALLPAAPGWRHEKADWPIRVT